MATLPQGLGVRPATQGPQFPTSGLKDIKYVLHLKEVFLGQ